MRNFRDTFETRKRSFISAFSICMTVPIEQSVLNNQFVPPIFCLCFAFSGINFRGMLHHVCDVSYDENM